MRYAGVLSAGRNLRRMATQGAYKLTFSLTVLSQMDSRSSWRDAGMPSSMCFSRKVSMTCFSSSGSGRAAWGRKALIAFVTSFVELWNGQKPVPGWGFQDAAAKEPERETKAQPMNELSIIQPSDVPTLLSTNCNRNPSFQWGVG